MQEVTQRGEVSVQQVNNAAITRRCQSPATPRTIPAHPQVPLQWLHTRSCLWLRAPAPAGTAMVRLQPLSWNLFHKTDD